MTDNTRTLSAILAFVALILAMFLGALSTPALPDALRAALGGDAVLLIFWAGIFGLAVAAALNWRRGWGRVVLAVLIGLTLGSLAPPMGTA